MTRTYVRVSPGRTAGVDDRGSGRHHCHPGDGWEPAVEWRACTIEWLDVALKTPAKAVERSGAWDFCADTTRPRGTRYQMREKLFAIGDDFWIETEDGQRAFKVDGKALRVRETFILESPSGEELFKIQEKKLHVRDTMEIERDGDTVATIKKALITPLRDRFAIELERRRRAERQGQHRRSRVRDRTRRREDRRDLQAVVPRPRHVRDRDRAGRKRRADPRGDRVHRRDGRAVAPPFLDRPTDDVAICGTVVRGALDPRGRRVIGCHWARADRRSEAQTSGARGLPRSSCPLSSDFNYARSSVTLAPAFLGYPRILLVTSTPPVVRWTRIDPEIALLRAVLRRDDSRFGSTGFMPVRQIVAIARPGLPQARRTRHHASSPWAARRLRA